jgi:hypothetical protein
MMQPVEAPVVPLTVKEVTYAKYPGLRKLRNDTDANVRCLFNDNWKRISISKKCHLSNTPLHVIEWYQKDVASFIPDKIVEGFVPFCPACEHQDNVNDTASQWVEKPKIHMGMDDYCLLDTKKYKCNRCKKAFVGYNQHSIKLGGRQMMDLFKFYQTKKLQWTTSSIFTLWSGWTLCHLTSTVY